MSTGTIALLIGAVLSSTDAAAVFSVLRRVPLPRAGHRVLEAESGFNDAPVVMLVVTLAAAAVPGASRTRGGSSLLIAVARAGRRRASIGLAVGYGGALAAAAASRSPSSGLFPIAVAGAGRPRLRGGRRAAHAAGFLAVYLAALVLGNTRLPHRAGRPPASPQALGWLAQIGLFVHARACWPPRPS